MTSLASSVAFSFLPGLHCSSEPSPVFILQHPTLPYCNDFKIYVYFNIFKFLFIYLSTPGLSRGTWDLVPWLAIKPRPPELGAQSLSHWTTRKIPKDFLKHRFYLFRAILGLQQNWGESTERSHISPAHIYGLSHYGHPLPEWYIYYNWWTYTDMALSPKVHS